MRVNDLEHTAARSEWHTPCSVFKFDSVDTRDSLYAVNQSAPVIVSAC